MAHVADRLDARALYAMLSGCSLAREIIVVEETASTNDLVARRACDGAAEGLVIFAETQTAGRGRQGRRWESAPHEGLLFSLLLRPKNPFGEWPRITTWAAVAIAEALDEFTPHRAAIKWPNDIYFEGRKAAGILAEISADPAGEKFAVLGIGVNVNQTSFPPELRAVSLRMLAGRALDRHRVAAAILHRLEFRHSHLVQDFALIVRETTNRSSLLGKTVSIGSAVGIAESIDENGALRIRTDDGNRVTVSSGAVDQ